MSESAKSETSLTPEQIETLDGMFRVLPGPLTVSVYEPEDGGPPVGALHGDDTSYEATLCEFWSGEHDNEECAVFVAGLVNAWPQLRDMALRTASLESSLQQARRERDEAVARTHDFFCEGCQQRYSGPPDHGCSRASCTKCGKWMLHYQEYRAERAEHSLAELRERLRLLAESCDEQVVKHIGSRGCALCAAGIRALLENEPCE